MKNTSLTGVWKDTHLQRGCYAFLSFIILISLFAGCAPQKKVTYIPPDKRVYLNVEAALQQRTVHPADSLEGIYHRWKGVPYRRGGMTHQGVDCSGFTIRVYRELYGKELPRKARDQSRLGRTIAKSGLRPGDLVFFKTGIFSRHVGIYYGENRFIHASRSKGVMISSLSETYWRKRFFRAARF